MAVVVHFASALAATGQTASVTAIVKQDHDKETLFYSFALVCKACSAQRPVMNQIALAAFETITPEDQKPKLLV